MYDIFLDEIISRCNEQNIDISNCYIMFERGNLYFNGEVINGYTESKDGRFICIPVRDESVYIDRFEYYPQCFEIKDKFHTYLSDGSMSVLTTVWLLYK